MKQDTKGLKVQLLAAYEKRLDEMLLGLDEDRPLDLGEIEDLALRVRAQAGQDMTQALVDRETGTEVPGPPCPVCGKEMAYKGHKRKCVRTRSGEVKMNRPYYYCPACRQGLFPPG
jgi:hypothetical protein